MDSAGFYKAEKPTEPAEPVEVILDWKSASAKKRSFNLGISSLKDSVELYARRPIIIPIYNFKNSLGDEILTSENNGIYIGGIVPFDGCSFSDIYLLSNADMNKVMQSNPLIIKSIISSDNLTNKSTCVNLENVGLVTPFGYMKVSAQVFAETSQLLPIVYDDGSYSYSNLNLIEADNLVIAPFELIESVPVPAGE
jgi:hypothetical protein